MASGYHDARKYKVSVVRLPYLAEIFHHGIVSIVDMFSCLRVLCGVLTIWQWVPRFQSAQDKSIRDLTLLAPHSRHGDKTLGVRVGKKNGVGIGLRSDRHVLPTLNGVYLPRQIRAKCG